MDMGRWWGLTKMEEQRPVWQKPADEPDGAGNVSGVFLRKVLSIAQLFFVVGAVVATFKFQDTDKNSDALGAIVCALLAIAFRPDYGGSE